jgi:hypothetical protein
MRSGCVGLLRIRGVIAMKNLPLRFFALLSVLAFAPVALIPQATVQGILYGNWTLNTAKCNFGGGPRLMAMTVKVVSDTHELIQYSVEQTVESGFQVSYSFKGAADGKEYPLAGSSSIYSYTEEPGVVHETQRDADGTITKGDFTVSPNGKVGTWNYIITNPDKTVVKQKLVFVRTD